MRRRVLVDSMAEDQDLAQLGMVANLVFDRMITIADDAGLCPADPRAIKGRCFTYCDDMTNEKIGKALDALVKARLIYRGQWRGKSVACFKTNAFHAHQRLRADYKRSFDYGELSEVVYSQGLAGFRSEVERESNGSRSEAEPTITGTNSNSDTDTESESDRTRVKPDGRQSLVLTNGVHPAVYVDASSSERFRRAPDIRAFLGTLPEKWRVKPQRFVSAFSHAIDRLSARGDPPAGHDWGTWLRERVRAYVESPLGRTRFRVCLVTWLDDDGFDEPESAWVPRSDEPEAVEKKSGWD